MNLHQLQHRIARAETVLDGRQQQMQAQWTTLQRVWRQGWTPLRIVVVGLGAGFLAGRAEPAAVVGKIGGARWLQMISAVSGLLTASKASEASDHAERAADTAQGATQDAAGTVDPVAAAAIALARQARAQAQAHAEAAARLQAGLHPAQPRPAEAATDLSER